MPDLTSKRPDLGSKRPDLGSERLDLGSERPELGSERLDLGSHSLVLRLHSVLVWEEGGGFCALAHPSPTMSFPLNYLSGRFYTSLSWSVSWSAPFWAAAHTGEFSFFLPSSSPPPPSPYPSPPHPSLEAQIPTYTGVAMYPALFVKKLYANEVDMVGGPKN